MRRDSSLPRRHALVAAVMIISGSCGADSAPAQVATSGDEPAPAQVYLVTGELARKLAALEYTAPILVGGVAEGVVVTNEEPGVDSVRVSPDVSQELRDRCGIIYGRMELADKNARPRILVNTPSQSGELRLPLPTMQRSALGGSSPIILAHAFGTLPAGHPLAACSTAAPPSCCTNSLNTQRCHSTRRHFWTRSSISPWCEHASTCNCC